MSADMEKEYWKKLEEYAQGKLQGEEQAKIEAWLAEDEEARTVLEGIRELQRQIPDDSERAAFKQKTRDDIVQAMASKLGANQQNPKEPALKPTYRKPWPAIVAAASVALLIGLGVWLLMPTSPSSDAIMADMLEEPYEISKVNLMGSGADKDIPAWQKAYEAGEYQKVITELSGKESLEDEALFFLGMSHLYLGEYKTATDLLQNPQLRSSKPYGQQSKYFLAIALVKTNEIALAMKELREIADAEKWWRQEEATQLLEALEKEQRK